MAVTTAHEVYGRALLFMEGKPLQHDNGAPLIAILSRSRTGPGSTSRSSQAKRSFRRSNVTEGSVVRKENRKVLKALPALALTLLLTTSAPIGRAPVSQPHPTSSFTFCNFLLPTSLKEANASFNVAYPFTIDEEGKRTNLAKIMNDFLDAGEMRTCLESWSFRGVQKSATFVAIFRWQHGEGWVDLSVTGPGLNEKISVAVERCPYRVRKADHDQGARPNPLPQVQFLVRT
jgi:hypothetical protein